MSDEQLQSRVTMLEKRNKRTILILLLLFAAMLGGFGFQWRKNYRFENPQKLTVRELAVADEHGTERVVIAAPVPEPRIKGQTKNTGRVVSGILIYDATGTERGGYVTADGYANAFLTLDGQEHQTFLLLAEPDGSTLFRIWNGDNGSIVMGAGDHPFLNVNVSHKPIFTVPVNNPESHDPRPLFR